MTGHPRRQAASGASRSRSGGLLPAAAACLLCAVAGRGFGADGDVYARKNTWAETVLATKAAYKAAVDSGRVLSLGLGTWHSTKGFKTKSFDVDPLPSGTVDLKTKKLWRRQSSFRDGQTNMVRIREQMVYLCRTVTAHKEGTARVSLGIGGNGFDLFVNGNSVARSSEKRSMSASKRREYELPLRRGENTILLKLYKARGKPQFYFKAADDILPAAWQRLSRDFPTEMFGLYAYMSGPDLSEWVVAGDPPRGGGGNDADLRLFTKIASRCGEIGKALVEEHRKLGPGAPRLAHLLQACRVRGHMESDRRQLARLDLEAFSLALDDLASSHPALFTDRAGIDERIGDFEAGLTAVRQGLERGRPDAVEKARAFLEFRRGVLLRNPLIDFEELLFVRRSQSSPRLGLPNNWLVNAALPRSGFDNTIERWAIREPAKASREVYRPERDVFVGDVDLHFDAERVLFSSVADNGQWHVFEVGVDGKGLRQVTPDGDTDIDHFDACYLPDGRITFTNTGGFHGVPCIGGNSPCGNLHIMNADGSGIRRLCFDQDQNWCPTVMPDGRVLYTRWEYTDSAHYFSRLLMTMNPDGTGQREFYGSNSYWPNALFYARPLPADNNRFIAVVSGHHGVARMGELILFDKSRGRHEADGVIQRIPGRGKKVEPVIRDGLVNSSWPRFLHPYPLGEKYHLVSGAPVRGSPWGIYLVDVFDNLVQLKEEPGFALLEPVPLKKTPRPPVIPDRIRPGEKDAVVYIQDIYKGPGLRGVPRGVVKRIMVFHYEYAYRRTGGHYAIGVEGPWDARVVLGTVPVESDGSAVFKAPANVPLSLLPLDAEGKAVQMMRSWFTAMPGEVVSCVGCHENLNSAAPLDATIASRKKPGALRRWYGAPRGFSFDREVQPVLDRYCLGCHDGKAEGRPDFTRKAGKGFPSAYLNLHPYVRRNGPEGNYHLLTPLEFHADTSELVQMLVKGHHNVKLDEEAWDRLIAWIDQNCPAYGSWSERGMRDPKMVERRQEMNRRYACLDYALDVLGAKAEAPIAFVKPEPEKPIPPAPKTAGWPFSADEAKRRQAKAAVSGKTRRTIDLGKGVTLTLSRIPAGSFVMGDRAGCNDERPLKVVEIRRRFWIATTEISAQQYQRFVPAHRNGYYDMHWKDQTGPGYLMEGPELPAIRASWNEANEYCRWLSKQTGLKVSLPTEAQWEWACRAGTGSQLWYGDVGADFSKCANLADVQIRKLAVKGINPKPIPNPDSLMDFLPKDARFDDGVIHLAKVGSYKPNPWGLHDMHGNVAEWTRSTYTSGTAGGSAAEGMKVVRGGSWGDRPKGARSSYRWRYPAWQRVFDVGFRVVVEGD